MGNFLDEQVEVPRRTMVLFFIVDTSGSMSGAKIGAVNNAIEEVLPEIAKISASNADAEVKIAVLDFSNDAKWLTPKPVEAEAFVYNYLEAGGMTAFGQACLALNEKLSRKEFMKETAGSFAPVLFLLSDGAPTDRGWEKGLEKLKENKWYQVAIKVAIAIGNDANHKVLEAFTGYEEAVLTVHTPAALKQMIKFVSVTSSDIGSKSSSVPLGTDSSPSDAAAQSVIPSKQEEFNNALVSMAPAVMAPDDDDEDIVW